MTETLALVMVLLLGLVLFFQGYAIINHPRNTNGASWLSKAQQDDLRYVRQLLVNYHTAHQASPLTGTEIEEVLRLCRAELDKVLEG